MFRHRQARKPKIQIDALWLLGPDPASVPNHGAASDAPARTANPALTDLPSRSSNPSVRPKRGIPWRSLGAVAALMAVTTAVACNWESWSQRLLRWQWERALASERTDDETLASLVALGDAVENSTVLLIQQLKSENRGRRTLAFQVLKNRCQSPSFQTMPPRHQADVVQALEQFTPADPEGIMMRGWLAARFSSQLASNDPAKVELRKRLGPLLDAASAANPKPAIHTQPITNTGTTNTGTTNTGHTNTLNAAPGVGTVAGKISVPPAPSLPPPAISTALAYAPNRAWESPNQLRDQRDSSAGDSPAPKGAPSTMREPSRIRLSGDAVVRTAAAPQSMSLSDRDEPATPPIENSTSIVVQVAQKRSIDSMLAALASPSDLEMTQAVQELQARGFSDAQIDWAVDLARGSAQEKLQAMERLTQEPRIEPVPWLVCMARGDDRDVKLKAIALLGSIADPEAVRQLRLIQQRESDPRVAAQIHQALQVTAAVQSKNR